MSPSLDLYRLDFGQLSALLYRDTVKQKHSDRARLNKELEDKKQDEDNERAQRRITASSSKPPVNTFVSLVIEHLLAVAQIETKNSFVQLMLDNYTI